MGSKKNIWQGNSTWAARYPVMVNIIDLLIRKVIPEA